MIEPVPTMLPPYLTPCSSAPSTGSCQSSPVRPSWTTAALRRPQMAERPTAWRGWVVNREVFAMNETTPMSDFDRKVVVKGGGNTVILAMLHWRNWCTGICQFSGMKSHRPLLSRPTTLTGSFGPPAMIKMPTDLSSPEDIGNCQADGIV